MGEMQLTENAAPTSSPLGEILTAEEIARVSPIVFRGTGGRGPGSPGAVSLPQFSGGCQLSERRMARCPLRG